MAQPKRFQRPQRQDQLLKEAKEIFSHEVKAFSEKEKIKFRKRAAAVVWSLDQGYIRVAENTGSSWVTHTWVKRAILTLFSQTKPFAQNAGVFEYFDKLPTKKRSSLKNVRVVPGAVVRYGAFIAPGAILMPSFVNIGAFVGEGTMVDTWATVGSCAQIGRNVHLSGGVGIGGVLEPAQAAPVIIGDNVFVGSRAIVVEGVRIENEAVLGAGVILTASTKIVDVRGSEPKISTGVIPERAVVIPGTLNKEFAAGTYGVPCALIIGERKPSTDLKTSLTSALREYNVSV